MLVIGVLFPLALLIGCKGPGDGCAESATCETDTDSDTDSDTDTDTDSDTDTDTDTDTDADTDSDTDADTDVPFVLSCDTTVVATEPCLVAADGSGTYTTIQEAVDLASEGDVITVCPGYYDSVVIDRVGVSLSGYGEESTCIIGSAAPGLILEGVDVDISGFTVSGQGDDGTAGGIHALHASGAIHDLRVAGVEPNAWDADFAAASAFSELTWQRITFEENQVERAFVIADGTTTVRHSVFRGNLTAIQHTALADGSRVEVTNCLFTGNNEGLVAGGGRGLVANNLFHGNNSAVQATGGGWEVLNNVALSNFYAFSGVDYSLDYNVAWDNYVDWAMSWPHGEHDRTIDPRFEDSVGGDFRLKADSPLIDAGHPDSIYNDSDSSRNDIGFFGGPYGSWSPP